MLTITLQRGFIFVIFILLQLWFIFHQQLFGDEAFYWLEGRYLDVSYSELPGWTAWMIRFGTWLLGDNYFAVRIMSYLGFLSIFLAAHILNCQIKQKTGSNTLLLLAIPLLVLIAGMALPDIWLLVFVMWIGVFFAKAIDTKRPGNWMILGVIIACSINVHVRMWIWLFVAGLVFLFVYKDQQGVLKPLLLITLPIALLGFVPILWFNYQHDFALFTFQFGRRHPWQFQASNLWFILSQFVVITPLLWFLWLRDIFQLKNKARIVQWIALTAAIHALLYLLLSFFADGLRTTVHWLLISYVPVLAMGISSQNSILRKWAMVSGLLASLLLLLIVNFHKTEESNIAARILDNSIGWHELSTVVKRIEKQQGIDNLVTDYFMTGAELAFELGREKSIKVLPHTKNIKHGRQKQLQIMDILLENPKQFKQAALLVVEDSTLKLKNKGKYYSQLCQDFGSVQWLESLPIKNSNKLFHLFKINAGAQTQCEIPPLFYLEQKPLEKQIQISGWAILHHYGIKQLYFVSGERNILIANNQLINKGVKNQFPEINDPNSPNIGFEVKILNTDIVNNQFQLKAIGNDNHTYFSQTYYLD